MEKFFAENYLKCWKFAVECRWFFVFAFGFFSLMFLIGFAFPVFFRAEIFEFIATLMLEIEGKSTLGLIGFIFLNNLQATFMAMMLGVFFGIFPLLTCAVNGYLLGFVAREAVVSDGVFVMWNLLPHGVFELPAVIFSIGVGLRLGVKVGILVFRGSGVVGKKGKKVQYVFREGLRFFLFVVFPLLVVAGIIEGILVGLVN